LILEQPAMCEGVAGVSKPAVEVFLSYSRNDQGAATLLHAQLERAGLSVFKDDKNIRWSDLWLDKLQEAVDGCDAFVVLVGRDGVKRWIGAETQVALSRYFGLHDDAKRLPIFPILLDGTEPDTLPAFLRLFQVRPWNGADSLPDNLLEQIRERTIVADKETKFEGCPYVGLAAYTPKQAHLFFGRQKETLDALACFFDTRPGSPAVRWLEINGNSGSGKSSLMQAGLLPIIDKGWLWRPGRRYEHWTRIGPMMPGAHPIEMLAECLARAFNAGMANIVQELARDDHALRFWLRERKGEAADMAFLLAIDQFEELFTFADPNERRRLDRMLAAALEDADCPLFVISTVRSDFLDRFAEDLPRLVAVRNRQGRPWTLAPIGDDALREVIEGPARLAGLDVGEVKEAMVAEARDEPGALPLVENALHFLWEQRAGNRLSGRLFSEQGGLAGILSRSADTLLSDLAAEQSAQALELLFQLVRVDPEGPRHARRRLPFAEAVELAGGGESGRALINRLAGVRALDPGKAEAPVRLITITDEGRWVNLIHETLIRSKGLDADGKPQPYWETLWQYIEQHKERAAWREQLGKDMRTWLVKGKAPGFQWSHERVRELHAIMQRPGPKFELNPLEREFLEPIDLDAMLQELVKQETTHKRRLLIGERLDVLGEHPSRWGVEVDENRTPRIDWCPVPGGTVTISILSDSNHLYSEGEDTLPKTVEPFHIARYPITAVQYRAFIDADDGWRDPGWWGEDLYRDPEGNTYGFGRFSNHPAVYVSWFDAVAFCRWLSQRLGFTVRLPDEWEWQQAATGGNDENIFPWGPEWDVTEEPWRANTFESRLGQATTVGMYPAGVALTGALDMAGTVWEWCLNKYDKPDVTQSRVDDFDPRVQRGGSWNYRQDFARSTVRFRYNPSYRSNDSGIGFRVVCSSPSAGH
jgi:formylglycine-generating enzyme required for sulfatase activity